MEIFGITVDLELIDHWITLIFGAGGVATFVKGKSMWRRHRQTPSRKNDNGKRCEEDELITRKDFESMKTSNKTDHTNLGKDITALDEKVDKIDKNVAVLLERTKDM